MITLESGKSADEMRFAFEGNCAIRSSRTVDAWLFDWGVGLTGITAALTSVMGQPHLGQVAARSDTGW